MIKCMATRLYDISVATGTCHHIWHTYAILEAQANTKSDGRWVRATALRATFDPEPRPKNGPCCARVCAMPHDPIDCCAAQEALQLQLQLVWLLLIPSSFARRHRVHCSRSPLYCSTRLCRVDLLRYQPSHRHPRQLHLLHLLKQLRSRRK